MSLWRRAPRQVYCVYGQDEYLSQVPSTGENEPQHDEAESHFVGRPPDPAAGAAIAGSRAPRLIGVGLLLGATIAAAGLVVSHLHVSHPHAQSFGQDGGASAPAAAHGIPPASSGAPARRAPGASGATPGSQARSTQRSATRAWNPESSRPAIAAGPGGRPRIAGAAAAGQTVAAHYAAIPLRARADASTYPQAPVASVTAGEEFEFER